MNTFQNILLGVDWAWRTAYQSRETNSGMRSLSDPHWKCGWTRLSGSGQRPHTKGHWWAVKSVQHTPTWSNPQIYLWHSHDAVKHRTRMRKSSEGSVFFVTDQRWYVEVFSLFDIIENGRSMAWFGLEYCLRGYCNAYRRLYGASAPPGIESGRLYDPQIP